MAVTLRSRKDIPPELLDAKKSAVADFLTKETIQPLAAFAARPSPSHNLVGIGIGHKLRNGKPTSRHSIRFYVERKLPDKRYRKNTCCQLGSLKFLRTWSRPVPSVLSDSRIRSKRESVPLGPAARSDSRFREGAPLWPERSGRWWNWTAICTFSATTTCSPMRTSWRSDLPYSSLGCSTRTPQKKTRSPS